MKSSFFWGSTVSRNTIEAAQAAVLKPKDGLQLAIKQLLTRCLNFWDTQSVFSIFQLQIIHTTGMFRNFRYLQDN